MGDAILFGQGERLRDLFDVNGGVDKCSPEYSLDPARWLADTLEALPTCPNSRIDSLLPFTNSTQV